MRVKLRLLILKMFKNLLSYEFSPKSGMNEKITLAVLYTALLEIYCERYIFQILFMLNILKVAKNLFSVKKL